MIEVRCTLLSAPPTPNVSVLFSLRDGSVTVVDAVEGAVVAMQPVAGLVQIDTAGGEVQLLFLGSDGIFDLIWVRCRDNIEAARVASAVSAVRESAADNPGMPEAVRIHEPGWFSR